MTNLSQVEKTLINYYATADQNSMFMAVGTKSDQEQAAAALRIAEKELVEVMEASSLKEAVEEAEMETGIAADSWMEYEEIQ